MSSIRKIKRHHYRMAARAKKDVWFRHWFWQKVLGRIPTPEELAKRRYMVESKMDAWKFSGSKLPFLKWMKRNRLELT